MALQIRRALLIVNPASRTGARRLRKAEATFRDMGVHCDTRTTESPGHGAALARELASRYDAVFTLGGDGTAIEVIGALARPVRRWESCRAERETSSPEHLGPR